MVTVTTSPDCGNAPKQTFVRDMLIAAARGDRDAVASAVADDWVHRIAGHEPTSGAGATDQLIAMLAPSELDRLDFAVVMSHGKFVAATGRLSGAGFDTEFSCMVTFTGHSRSALIAECVTYLVPQPTSV